MPLTKKCGTMTVDHFALYKNSKSSRFNSRYVCPSTEAVNTFSQDWSNEGKWLVSPIYLIPKCLTHFTLERSGTTAILMLSCWSSATFWPLLFEKQNRFTDIIHEILYLPSAVLQQRDYDGFFIGSKTLTLMLCRDIIKLTTFELHKIVSSLK